MTNEVLPVILFFVRRNAFASMVELEDTPDLGSDSSRSERSNRSGRIWQDCEIGIVTVWKAVIPLGYPGSNPGPVVCYGDISLTGKADDC